ncbi:polycomb group protein Psc-like [Mytilus californianus]|uniref:polycomb group protein Psc-like n=1 Tax=Mytilus californianus TaxID=6549 RepID=UPI0022485400|nr:polycomb group protein Psc-like [Mytilus californianus]
MAHRPKRTSLRHLREHLVCVLCGGYLIDATTIVECLHSFCKTCIVRYLDSSKFCPICDVQVHKTKPLVNIRMDHTLQDMVYKLVPNLFHEEMKRRREFYKENIDEEDSPEGPWPEYYIDDDGEIQRERVIFSDDEQISLSLQLSTDGKPPKSPDKRDPKSSTEMTDCRYLLCPAAVTVSHLKKFIRLKFNLCDRYQIDVYHSDEILQDHYTLMDIAYIYAWRRRGPLRLFYTVYTNPAKRIKRSISATVTSDIDTSIVEMPCTTKPSESTDDTDKKVASPVQTSTKYDDQSKSETKKPEIPSSTTSSSKCTETVSSTVDFSKQENKVQMPTNEIVTQNLEIPQKTDTKKTSDIQKMTEIPTCTQINVPIPHRSFLLGPKPKEKTETKQKELSSWKNSKDKILSLPVKHPDSKITVPHPKPVENVSKVSTTLKLPSASFTHSNGKITNTNATSQIMKASSSSTSTGSKNSNSIHDKQTKRTHVDCCVSPDTKKPKYNTESIAKTGIYKNGKDNHVNKPVNIPYVSKSPTNLVGSTLSSADKARKLLHIPERPLLPYAPMAAHYQSMNGFFNYRSQIQDYGNDAPQDLSMKKKSSDSNDNTKNLPDSTKHSPPAPKSAPDNKQKKEKNGEIDKYAFTDDDAATPVTSRKLQHVKSEPLTLN